MSRSPSGPVRLAIIATHPIQYYAPIFRELASGRRVNPRVFYTWSQAATGALVDLEFGRRVQWDIPLLEGYEHQFVPNVSRRPGSNHFWGLRNPALGRAIADWCPHALLVFGWRCASHLAALRHFKRKVPVFFRGDSTLLDERGSAGALARRACLAWVYRYVDVPIAVGSNNRDYYLWAGVPPERIAFAPHAIDTMRFGNGDDERAAAWRGELGIRQDERVVLFAGKFIPKKDPLLLLEAFLRANCGGHLILLGNGALEVELRRRAAGVPNIHFLPFQNQQAMPSAYRLADVFVLPSCGPGETWGLALNEAMACGRAVIASSRAGGARDLVSEGVNGWIFESGNLARLTDILRTALTGETGMLRRMGEAGRSTIADWSISAAARRIEEAVLEFTVEGALSRGFSIERPTATLAD